MTASLDASDIAFVGIAATVLIALMGALFQRQNGIIDRISRLEALMAEVRTDNAWIKNALRVAGNEAGNLLHSPHTPEFDILIEHFWHNTLDQKQACALAEKLTTINDDVTYGPAQKLAAAQMLASLCVEWKIEIPHKNKNNHQPEES